ncbi:hypothetical protein [Streptococcus merionis]|uniref:hypothetical protein n=1 Tax=Streptococcus merionis TaxID=400065 RepID=UPI0035157154
MQVSVDDYIAAIEELDWLDDVLIQVIHLIPERYFYHPDIELAEFQKKRLEIKRQRQKMLSFIYRGDQQVRHKFHRLVYDYQESLRLMVLEKKSDLALYLLYLDSETKKRYLTETIDRYHLIAHLFQFN